MPCDLQPYYSGEEPYGTEQQRERPGKACPKGLSFPSVAVSISEECIGREQAIFQPSPFFQPRLCKKQEQMTEFGNRLIRHEFLEQPIPEHFTEG
jgi:hypothetical protein